MKETRFKDTEIGRIPEDWNRSNLGSICKVKRGIRITKDQLTPTGKYPVFQNTNYPMGFYSHYNVEANTPFVIIGGSAGLIGCCKTHYWAADDCAYFSYGARIIHSFLYYELLHRKSELQNNVKTASVPRLDRKVLEGLVFPLPPLSEQNRIASALTSIDNLISSLDKLIEKKKAIKEGTMQQLLTGKKRLKGFNEPWYHYTLGDCTTIKARIGWQGLTASEYLDYGQYYLVTAIDINEGKISWDTCHYVSEERYLQDKNIQILPFDVLVSKDGTIGKVAFLDSLPGPGTLNSGVFVIRSKMKYLTQEYLAQVFLSKYFDNFIKEIVAGSTIVHLYQKDIVKFSFDAPSSIKEQQAIVSFISSINEEIASLESKRNKYIKTKQGMMQQLLTGRIRLV